MAAAHHSVASRRDSCDKALAESTRLFKTEVSRRRGPWQPLEYTESGTLWVDSLKTRPLPEPIEYVPPRCTRSAIILSNRNRRPSRHSHNPLPDTPGPFS